MEVMNGRPKWKLLEEPSTPWLYLEEQDKRDKKKGGNTK